VREGVPLKKDLGISQTLDLPEKPCQGQTFCPVLRGEQLCKRGHNLLKKIQLTFFLANFEKMHN
jgi:hypothetical protein